MASSSKNRPPTFEFESEEQENEFVKWFWQESNGNDLIKKLNAYSEKKKSDDFIRREKESPAIYAIVLNDDDLVPFIDEEKQWKLCKVGFTHGSIKRGSNNRMEKLEDKINKKYNAKKNEAGRGDVKQGVANTIFAIRIGAVDTTKFSETEKRIRKKVGTPISKTKAKELGLPVPTEWVLTTQDHINGIQKMKTKKMKEVEKKGEGDVIDFFKDTKDAPDVPESQKEWLLKVEED